MKIAVMVVVGMVIFWINWFGVVPVVVIFGKIEIVLGLGCLLIHS